MFIVLFFIATIPYQIYSYQDNKCPNVDEIRKCLTDSGISTKRVKYYSCGIICPDKREVTTNDYCNDIAEEKNIRILRYPIAIVHPLNLSEVSEAIKCGAKNKIPVVARAGGHSYESYSIGDEDFALVVDLGSFTNIVINQGEAVVGPGIRLGKLYYELNKARVAFPSGNCPSVGVGAILGGGEGRLTRAYGMSSDNLIDAQIVLADGSIIDSVKNHDNGDLLWALQGAGSAGYGIVTSLTLRTHPIIESVTAYELKYEFRLDTLKSLYSNINQFGQYLPKTLAVEIHQIFNPDTSKDKISVKGLYLGKMSDIKGYLEIIFNTTKSDYSESDWFTAIVGNGKKAITSEASEDEVNKFVDAQDDKSRNSIKVKSFYVGTEGLSEDGVGKLFNSLNQMKNNGCGSYVITTLYGGGKSNNNDRNKTAYVHRDFLYDIFINMRLPEDKKDQKNCVDQLNDFAEKFQNKYTSYESFQNYIDEDLKNWQCRYYGENFERLVDIKKRYDCSNVFRWKQSIPTTVGSYDKEQCKKNLKLTK
ncbi:23415_t:CDS:2 [Gigaspora rosea]|nr:23415_t:CDS:2 [Gigaspora rosea]